MVIFTMSRTGIGYIRTNKLKNKDVLIKFEQDILIFLLTKTNDKRPVINLYYIKNTKGYI